MSDTTQQYLAYLEAEQKRLKAIEEEMSKPVSKPTLLTSRFKMNGAGSFIWQDGHWTRL